MEGGDALRVLLASSPLVGTFFFDALLRISNSYSSGKLIQTIVFNDTSPKVNSVCVTFLGEACRIASSIVNTFLFAVSKSWEAFGIFLTGANLVTTLGFNAVYWGSKVH